MANWQGTLSSTPTVVQLDELATRVTVTIQSNPAEVYVTADGSYPAAPTTTINNGNVKVLAGVTGAQTVIMPPQNSNVPNLGMLQSGPPGSVLPAIRLASAGTPVVSLEW